MLMHPSGSAYAESSLRKLSLSSAHLPRWRPSAQLATGRYVKEQIPNVRDDEGVVATHAEHRALYQIAALGFKRGSELDVHRHSRSHVGKYHDFRKQDVVRKNFSSDLASTPSSSNLNDIFLSVQTKSDSCGCNALQVQEAITCTPVH